MSVAAEPTAHELTLAEANVSGWVTYDQDEVAARSVYQRVLAILEELPAIGKDSRNDQQKFMYRSHDAVLNALNPLLAKYGVFMVPRVVERTTDQRTTRQGGVMYEVNLHVEFTFFGAGGDSFVASAWGEGTDSGDKSTNKAMTMAFKNVIAQTFAVSTSETVDSDSTTDPETTGRSSAPGRARSDSPARREFNPGIDLMDGAASGEGFLARIGEQLHAVHPTVDWSATFHPLLYERFGVARVSELGDEQAAEHWRRVANTAAKLTAELDTNMVPPITDDKIREVIAWGYSTSIEAVTLTTREPTAEELAAAEAAAQAAEADG